MKLTSYLLKEGGISEMAAVATYLFAIALISNVIASIMRHKLVY